MKRNHTLDQNKYSTDIVHTTKTVTPAEREEALTRLILHAQQDVRHKLDKVELKTLSPFVDDDGIVRVGGRVGNAQISYDMKYLALLPRDQWLSRLIIRNAHQHRHSGVTATTAKSRLRYWIIRAANLAKTEKYRCTFCRELAARTEKQKMASLPRTRLQPCTPPFFLTSVDLFGPLTVEVGRNKTDKNYGVIFTCLKVRAVYIDLATDYSTEGFLQVLRRFFSIREYIHTLYSDSDSQLVGAEKELRLAVQG